MAAHDTGDETWTPYMIYGAILLSSPVVFYSLYLAVKSVLVRRVSEPPERPPPPPLNDAQKQRIDEVCPRVTPADLSEAEGRAQCSICLGDLAGRGGEEDDAAAPDVEKGEGGTAQPLRRLPCGHLFHAACVDPWLYRNMPCALCRCHPLQGYEEDTCSSKVAGDAEGDDDGGSCATSPRRVHSPLRFHSPVRFHSPIRLHTPIRMTHSPTRGYDGEARDSKAAGDTDADGDAGSRTATPRRTHSPTPGHELHTSFRPVLLCPHQAEPSAAMAA